MSWNALRVTAVIRMAEVRSNTQVMRESRWSRRLGIPNHFASGSRGRLLTERQMQAIQAASIVTGDRDGGMTPKCAALAHIVGRAVLELPGRYVVARPETATIVDTPEQVIALWHDIGEQVITVIDLTKLSSDLR